MAAAALTILFVSATPSLAVHVYRGPDSGCTPTDGPITDDATSAEGAAEATVLVMHNTFNDAANGTPVTRVRPGDVVEWQWWSAHCHSAWAGDGTFYSGFHYPTATPESPQAVPGFFDYPVPDDTPTLTYRHTFSSPGTYQYFCEHHQAIGMVGTVIVEDPATTGA